MTYSPRKCKAKNGPASCTSSDCPEKQDYKNYLIDLSAVTDYNEYNELREAIKKMEANNPLLPTTARPTPTYVQTRDLQPGTIIGGGKIVSVFRRHPQPANKRTVVIETRSGKQVVKEWGAYTKIASYPKN